MEDTFTLEIGSGLVQEVDTNQGGEFLKALQFARLSYAVYKRKELPPMHIKLADDLSEMQFRYAYYEVVFYEGALKKSWHLFKTLRRMIERIPGELMEADETFISEKFVSMAELYREEDDEEAALELFEKAIKYNSSNYDAYSRRGHCHQALRQYERAIDDYSTAIDLGESSAWLFRQRSLCYEKVSMFKHALEDNEMALAIELQDN